MKKKSTLKLSNKKNKRKSRGVSKCKKTLLNLDKCKVDFDEKGRPSGENAGPFMSWIGVEFKKRIPYDKIAKEVNPKEFEDIWEFTKETWNISNDVGKKVTLTKGKAIMRNFRAYLRKKYIYKDESQVESPDNDSDSDKDEEEDEDKGPFKHYDYLDKNIWDSFVKVVEKDDWKETRKKAQQSAQQNHEPGHVGRWGYAGLEPHVESRWNQLVSIYPFLNVIQDTRSKLLTVSKASFNEVTGLYELGEKLVSKDRMIGVLEEMRLKEEKLREDGSYSTKDVGPTECLFSEQKTKKIKSKDVKLAARESLNSCTEILSIQKCELLLPDDNEGAPKVVGMGRVHPNPERIIHNCQMKEGFVKVQVDRVLEGCGSTRLVPESCILDEIECMEDAKGGFIQWPIELVKILNKDLHQSVEPSHHSTSTLYLPQYEAISTHQQQTIPNERNEFQIYSYALQDDDAFNQLLVDEQFSHNTIEHVSLYKPVESVRDANQPIKLVAASKPSKEKTEVSKRQKTKIAKLLDMTRSSPQSIYELAQQVAIQAEKALSVVCNTPPEMHEKRFQETVEYEAVIHLCANGWADVCVVHWFTMYLFAIGRREGLNNTAYFHPRYIEGDLVSDDGDFVIDHIMNVISFHKDKQWFMAPHIIGRHWVLILLQHHPVSKTWKGHIYDSLKGTKDPSSYEITELFQMAIKQEIMWEMVPCRQQPNGWECGYCVMMAMYDFVVRNKEHLLESKKRMVRLPEINDFVERTVNDFISSTGDCGDEEDE